MPMVSKPNKIDYLCTRCGSGNVSSDASAEWCKESQSWVLTAVYDSMVCNDCEYDCNHGFPAFPYIGKPLYEGGVMVSQPVDKAVAEPVTAKLAVIPSPLIKRIQEGQVIDTSDFDLPD